MSVIPYLSYADAAAALTWLAEAFGLERSQAFEGPDGKIVHAEIGMGSGVVMVGTGKSPGAGAPELDPVSPRQHGIYVVVDDVDAHHARASGAGARIVFPPEDTEFGTRRYRALDLEGYEWSFGAYAPGRPG